MIRDMDRELGPEPFEREPGDPDHGIRKNGTATTLSPALTKMDPLLVALATTGTEKRRCRQWGM
jgi:hypothetical protein